MKKGIILGLSLLVAVTLLTFLFTDTFMQKAFAYAQDDLPSANSIFSGKLIESSGYLYIFDG